MPKKSLNTPRSQVRSALRRLWLRSRERQSALKRDGYRCQKCGLKQSRAKGKEVYAEVHHINKILDWEKVIDIIYQELLCSADFLETLCVKCHDEKPLERKGRQ